MLKRLGLVDNYSQKFNQKLLSLPQVTKGKRKGKGSKSAGFGGPGGSGTIGTNNPLSDPSLAQMATFLCITDEWSAWSACSVTCGVGTKTRTRQMIDNKKPELCQHVPLIMEEVSQRLSSHPVDVTLSMLNNAIALQLICILV